MVPNKSIKQSRVLSKNNWMDKVSNHHQLGGIETSILENGQAKGVRVAWINTGSGLRYKVVLDRAMDIADAFFNQHSLSWISRTGVTPPNQVAVIGMEWLKTFGGGLMVTCGLSHIGGPESDEFGNRGLHGNIGNQPAEIISVVQPDPFSGQLKMSITGIIKESCIFGPHLVLKRTISSTLGEAKIKLHDEITNLGNEPAPHMILYHCNFGWPLVDDGTSIFWNGTYVSGRSELDKQIFHEGGSYKTCREPIAEHNGKGEAIAFIDIKPDDIGMCTCGLLNSNLKIAFNLRFKKDQLPWLINWQHWGKGEYVTGLEPGTHTPTGQAKARKEGTLIYMKPGECKMYDMEMEVISEEEKIETLMKKILV
jgi:hypothetical protein